MGKNKGDGDKAMVKSLDEIPYGEMPKWGQTATFLINTKQQLGLGLNWKSHRAKLEISWQQQLADELHKPIKRNFTRRRVIVNGMDKIWCSDLAEIINAAIQQMEQGLQISSHGIESVLQIWLDWIVPLKDKKGETVNHNIYELIKGRSIITNTWRNCWKKIT